MRCATASGLPALPTVASPCLPHAASTPWTATTRSTFPALVNCAAIPLLLGARILFADWVSAVVIVLTVPLVPLFMVLIGRYTEDKVQDAQAALSRLSGHMLELAKGLPVLVGLGRASAQRRALEDISEEYRSRTMGTLRTAFLSALALELIATISVAVVAVFIGVRLVHGDMALEAGLLALILAPDCYLPLRELGTAHHASDDGRAALAETTAVLDAPEQRRLDPRPAPVPSVHDLTVSGLTVSYAGRQGAAVGPLSFTAPAGRITALDGPSGAGKSTVLGVLAGTIGSGGGTAVAGTLGGFAPAGVAWVPQHPVMVADTVREEILLYLAAGAPQDRRHLEEGVAGVPGSGRRSPPGREAPGRTEPRGAAPRRPCPGTCPHRGGSHRAAAGRTHRAPGPGLRRHRPGRHPGPPRQGDRDSGGPRPAEPGNSQTHVVPLAAAGHTSAAAVAGPAVYAGPDDRAIPAVRHRAPKCWSSGRGFQRDSAVRPDSAATAG